MTKIIIPDSIHRAEAEAAVRQILSGRGLEAVAAQFTDRGMDIRKFLRECGAPNNRMRLRTALATLEAGPDDSDLLDLPDTPEPASVVDQKDDLIDRGKASEKPSTVRLAERIEQLLDRLRSDLQAQEKERANADEIARLQQRIAELRGIDPNQTRPKTSGAKSKSDNAKVREWAASNGIDCPAHGRVPQAVRERYENRTAA